ERGHPLRRCELGWAGRVERRYHEDQRRDPIGMAQRQLHRGGSARRGAEHRAAGDLERVQNGSVRIGLCRRSTVRRERGAQVPEARNGDGPEAALDQALREVESLVEPTTGAMDDEDRQSRAGFSVLDWTARGLEYVAAGSDAPTRTTDVR